MQPGLCPGPRQGTESLGTRNIFLSLFVTPANLSLDGAPPPSLYSICIDFSLSHYKLAYTRTKK